MNNNTKKLENTLKLYLRNNNLKELKSLLDDGLISQDQYDKKSSEILNAF